MGEGWGARGRAGRALCMPEAASHLAELCASAGTGTSGVRHRCSTSSSLQEAVWAGNPSPGGQWNAGPPSATLPAAGPHRAEPHHI